jgi:hypothetical protein
MLSTGTPPPGAMRYTAFDAQGRTVVTGWILLDISDVAVGPQSSPVTGTWSLHALVDPNLVGWQQGQGNLEGNFSDGKLVVALYPGAVDFGCFLGGTLTFGGGPAGKMAYAGTWSDQSFTGPHHTGTFEATQ